MKRYLNCLYLQSILVMCTVQLFSQVPQMINYQARLTDPVTDLPVADDDYTITFSIYDGSSGGTALWTETQTVQTTGGVYSVLLGSSNPVDASLFEADERYLGIAVGSDSEMIPRKRLVSVPYALHAKTAETLTEDITETQDFEDVLIMGNDADFQKVDNLLIGNCSKCDATTTGCIYYDTINKKLQICNGEEWTDIVTVSDDLQEDAILVSPSGEDIPNCGTSSNPCKSITYGINMAVDLEKQYILAANGLYHETAYLTDSIDLLGGYDPYTWSRSLTNSSSVILGTDEIDNHPVTIVADNINKVEVSGFKIFGKDAFTSGKNSYTVYIKNSGDGLVLHDNVIFCAKAANGDDGMNGQDGLNGYPGNSGIDAFDSYVVYGKDTCVEVPGGSGGILDLGSSILSGGAGGGISCPLELGLSADSGLAGDATATLAGGAGGAGAYHAWVQAYSCQAYKTVGPFIGENGHNGLDGENGSEGSGGTDVYGSVVDSHWHGHEGTDGLEGNSGSSAGGGGGGACLIMHPSCFIYYGTTLIYAPTGGGGGSGAQGGPGGTGGHPGGASFGIFVTDGSPPIITNNIFYLGIGGNGGHGGTGGHKGIGGSGGSGGNISEEIIATLLGRMRPGYAGEGGKGGDGGSGGGGGGGTGGSSFGIYTYDTGTLPDYETHNIFTGGTAGIGGSGGRSIGNPGGDGSDGIVVNCSYH
ncbi:MAG: hypothetical protein JXR41_07150 [Bacteroidales bacterium]|nr:hypothetical protein [Bacteroidales bacterium]